MDVIKYRTHEGREFYQEAEAGNEARQEQIRSVNRENPGEIESVELIQMSEKEYFELGASMESGKFFGQL